ncbi:LLM class flavin-dependent oxidoreductase [Streptomyces shenzhenensis]
MTVRGPAGRQMHLAALAHCGPRADGSAPDGTPWRAFSSYERFARTAERGLFDFLLLAGGRLPREHEGRVPDADATGPEPVTVLGALAAVTERLGLAATVDAAFGEPDGLARRLATLDHLSGGRAAWQVATSADAVTDGNFRRAAAQFTVPRSPQGHPVLIAAGDADEDRESAAARADVVCCDRGFGVRPAAGRAFSADVKRRLEKYGRAPDDLKVMPAVGVVLGDTAAEARERAAELIEAGERPCFVGTPEAVAAELDAWVRQDAADGFVLVPHTGPGGLDEFVDRVVPLLQERGAFRTEYRGATLRSHLGLPAPARKD